MGFRISTEVGRMTIDMVWAEIAVAALAGSVFYGVVALIERAVHVLASVVPDVRRIRTTSKGRRGQMKRVLFGAFAATIGAGARARPHAADTVTLQLKWVTQAQFAGYYVAKDKGFYEDEASTSTSSRAAPTSRPSR